MKRKFFLLFFLIQSTLSISQEPTHYVIGKDIFDGINLYSIIQDKDDSIWITSDNGLYHYNGIKFTHIKSKNFKSQALFGLTKDSKGNIYCFTFSGQIFKIVNKQLELFYTIKTELIGGSININFDNNDNLLIATNHKIIYVQKEKTVIKDNRGFFFSKKGDTIIYGSDFNNKKTTGFVNYYNNTESKILEKDHKYHLLLNHSSLFIHKNSFYGFEKTNVNFFKANKDTVQHIKLNIPVNSNSIMFFCDDKFWFTDFRNGVYKITPDNLTEKADKWFGDYYISGVFIDKEENTWLLTFGGGIIIIPNLNIINHNIKNEKLVGINKIKNRIFVSTKSGKIYAFHNNKFSTVFEDKKGIFKYFNIINNNLFISNTKVYNKKKQTEKVVQYNRKAVLLNDTIYFALHSGVRAYSINDFSKRKQITRNRSNSLLADTINNKIWISSITGLSTYQNGIVTNITHNKKPIPAKEVININKDIWVATENGIFVIANDTVKKHLTQKTGLLNENIQHIKYKNPFVYLSNNKSLQQFNINTQEVKKITYSNGLTKRIKNFEVLNDTLYAMTTQGMFTFNFNNLNTKKNTYQTRIKKALVNGAYNLKDNDILNPQQNNIEFSFLTTSFRFQKDMNYQYQLKGYDEKPIKVKNGFLYARYSKLPAGKYTFEINSDIDGYQNIPQSISFKIKKEFYKQTWFKIFITFLLLFILYLVYITRIKMLTRKRNELELKEHLLESSLTSLKAQMNPHFMFNAINSVQSLIIKDQKNNAYNYLTKVSQLIRSALNSSEKTWIYFEDEIMQLNNYLELEKLRFSSNLDYQIIFNDELRTIKIPSMIVQPFLENAVKHGLLHKKESETKSISIHFKLNDKKTLLCYIKDNGIGREASKKINEQRKNHQSFSTQAIQKRFNLLNKYLNINAGFFYEDLTENGNSIGTLVTLKIPYINDNDE